MAKTRKPPPPPPPPSPPPLPAETSSPQRRRKKKGRPSLLDLQRRSLRLQAQNPSPAPSPTRRDPNPSDDDEDGTGNGGRRRQKRLKSVLSGGGVKEESGEGKKDAAKATGKGDAASDGGPTGTPLPDKKLLLFILDRLQKKDTYGVFSEPVDAEELPDYFDIVKHPMDFSTIREKLLNDSYSKLEQFEDDVFLLTSNAMCYNSADTIYFRQARSIEALAKKDFENLRQPSDEEEPKPPARRGRPPKNHKTEGDVSPDLSNVKTNKPEVNVDTFRKRSTGDRTRNTNTPMKDPSSFHNMLGSFSAKRTDKIGDYSGSSKWGKKSVVSLDDDRRSTYDQHYSRNSSLFAALDDERKLLVPVGVQQQHAYARSLARFASKLGPVGWDVAANRIRRALPPGTSFGPGWVVDGEPPQNSQWAPVTSTNPSECNAPPNMPSKNDVLHHKSGPSSNGDVTGEEHLPRTQTVASTSASFDKGSEIPSKVTKHENGVNKSCGGMDNPGSAAPPMQQHSHSREIHSNINGFTAMSNAMSQYAGQGLFGSGIPMTHAQVLGMFSGMNGKVNGYIHRHPVTADSLKTAAQNGDVGKATVNPVQGAGHDPKMANDNNSAHPVPGLNSGVQSSGSPPRGKLANPKHPDLALQL